MGFIRGFIVLSASFVFFLSLLAMNLSLSISLSLDYNTIKPSAISAIKETALDKFGIDKSLQGQMPLIKAYCENHSKFVVNATQQENFNQIMSSFAIPCNVIEQNESSLAIIDYVLNGIFDEIYYKEYDCGFFDCFKKQEEPYFIVSKHSQDYFQNKFYIFLLVSIFLSLIIFLFSESKSSAFILIGILITISSLPFAKLKFFLSFLPNISFLSFFDFLFEKASYVFSVIFAIGLSVFILGILLKFFNFGIKLSQFIERLLLRKKTEEKSFEKVELDKEKKSSEEKRPSEKKDEQVSEEKQNEEDRIKSGISHKKNKKQEFSSKSSESEDKQG